MKIERTPQYFEQYTECAELQGVISGLVKFLQSLELDNDGPGATSNKIKVPLTNWAKENGWRPNRIIDSTIPSGISNSIYKVNLLRDIPLNSCPHHHRVFFHCFFDNRQAIGTNLIRLDYAIGNFQTQESRIGHGVALVLDGAAKTFFGWDNAVGTWEEYDFAVKKTFSNFAKNPIDFWIIRG
jgi:hypothetical protein